VGRGAQAQIDQMLRRCVFVFAEFPIPLEVRSQSSDALCAIVAIKGPHATNRDVGPKRPIQRVRQFWQALAGLVGLAGFYFPIKSLLLILGELLLLSDHEAEGK